MNNLLTTKKEIKNWLTRHRIENYTINSDMSVDVEGDVDLQHCNIQRLKLQFNRVNGNFLVTENDLTSLWGSPKTEVTGDFFCNYNYLGSLCSAPPVIGGGFY